jgi:hypothetical protein
MSGTGSRYVAGGRGGRPTRRQQLLRAALPSTGDPPPRPEGITGARRAYRAPADAGIPFLNVTLRNTGAIRIPGAAPGAHHALHLSTNPRTVRPLSDIRTCTSVVSMPDSDDR